MAPRTVTRQAPLSMEFSRTAGCHFCGPTTNAKEAKLNVLWRPVRPSRTNAKKDVLFIIGDCNAKVGSQEIPGVTGKFGLRVQNEAGQRVTEFCQENTGHRKHPLSTTQEKTLHIDFTRVSIPKSDWLYSLYPKMEKLYTVSKNQTGSWLWLRSWTHCQIQT